MIDPNDYEDCIAAPTLEILSEFDERLGTKKALHLMMGIVAQESDMGRFLKQKGDGPAIGAPQVEPNTHQSIWEHYLSRSNKRSLALLVAGLAPVRTVEWGDTDSHGRSVHHISDEALHEPRYCFAIARLKLWPKRRPLPGLDERIKQAAYWDDFYNANNINQIDEFVKSYETWLSGWRHYAPTI